MIVFFFYMKKTSVPDEADVFGKCLYRLLCHFQSKICSLFQLCVIGFIFDIEGLLLCRNAFFLQLSADQINAVPGDPGRGEDHCFANFGWIQIADNCG